MKVVIVSARRMIAASVVQTCHEARGNRASGAMLRDVDGSGNASAGIVGAFSTSSSAPVGVFHLHDPRAASKRAPGHRRKWAREEVPDEREVVGELEQWLELFVLAPWERQARAGGMERRAERRGSPGAYLVVP